MTAECWWCALGIAKIVQTARPHPLGCCYDCRVFACGGHAELDRYKGKWLCLQSAAQAAARGAGIAAPVAEDVAIASSLELEERLPAVAQATEEDRAFFFAGAAEGWLYEQPDRFRERGIHVTDPRLLGDALGIGRFIERNVRERLGAGEDLGGLERLLIRAAPRRPAVVLGMLGQLLTEAPQ